MLSRTPNLHVPRVLLTLLVVFAVGAVLAPGVARADLPPGGTFVDDDGNAHEGYIEAIAAKGITHGCREGQYCPEDPIRRGEMAAFLRRALGLPSSSTDWFGDDEGSIFEDDINALAEAGITKGCGDGGGFCPDGVVTRGEMAAFLRRARDLPASSRDHFGDDTGHVFEDDINAIAEAGITKGCGDTRFCVDGHTTRAQMASFIGRALGLEPTPPPQRETDMGAREAIRQWFGDVEREALRVADCESSLNPEAVNPRGYHGLFQIGEFHADRFRAVTGKTFSDGVYSAYHNAEYARYLYDGDGGSWKQWGCKP